MACRNVKHLKSCVGFLKKKKKVLLVYFLASSDMCSEHDLYVNFGR